MGYSNIGPMYEMWSREFLRNAEVQAEAAGMLARAQGRAQLEVQQQMQAAQQPPQAPDSVVGAEQGISNSAFGALGAMGPGVNPAMGGMAPANAAPTMTREAITQRDFSTQR
jgi:hypothetical protein